MLVLLLVWGLKPVERQYLASEPPDNTMNPASLAKKQFVNDNH
jgi:hypothetical protein